LGKNTSQSLLIRKKAKKTDALEQRIFSTQKEKRKTTKRRTLRPGKREGEAKVVFQGGKGKNSIPRAWQREKPTCLAAGGNMPVSTAGRKRIANNQKVIKTTGIHLRVAEGESGSLNRGSKPKGPSHL